MSHYVGEFGAGVGKEGDYARTSVIVQIGPAVPAVDHPLGGGQIKEAAVAVPFALCRLEENISYPPPS